MIQTSDNPYRNNNLFSNYYLEKYLPESLERKKKDHIAVFEQIVHKLYGLTEKEIAIVEGKGK